MACKLGFDVGALRREYRTHVLQVPMSMLPDRGVVSWSGGKDSCLALLRARADGLSCDTLLTMKEPAGPSKSHALPATLLRAQARAMRMRWLPARSSLAGYARAFAQTQRDLRGQGHRHIVFGDIDLKAHRAARLPAEFCAASYDAALLRRLPEGVCPCGEGGEFHTFVWDAPCFVRPLSLRRGRRRRVPFAPPLAPTELVFEAPVVVAATP